MRTEAVNIALFATFCALGLWPWWGLLVFYAVYLLVWQALPRLFRLIFSIIEGLVLDHELAQQGRG